jgi:hypothetical protein
MQPRGSGAGRHQTERDGAEQCSLRAVRRRLDAKARDIFGHARPDLDQGLAERGELATGEWARLWDRGAHAMHQPERRDVEGEPHLVGDRAVTRTCDPTVAPCVGEPIQSASPCVQVA